MGLQVYTLEGLSIMGVEETQGLGSYRGASWNLHCSIYLKRATWTNAFHKVLSPSGEFVPTCY